jgi:5-formyltetrahydrofolate cyclo-ligase
MLKKDLRQTIRERKRQFTQQQLDELSSPIIKRLLNTREIKQAKTVLMYYSLPDEVNTHKAINALVNDGKRVLLPVVVDGENMEIHQYTGEKDLKDGAFHIKEPVGKLYSDYSDIDVAVVPGMSFDKSRNRLGRGKGYYDRFLKKIPNVLKIGVCFDFQKEDAIPTEGTDVKMDSVI